MPGKNNPTPRRGLQIDGRMGSTEEITRSSAGAASTGRAISCGNHFCRLERSGRVRGREAQTPQHILHYSPESHTITCIMRVCRKRLKPDPKTYAIVMIAGTLKFRFVAQRCTCAVRFRLNAARLLPLYDLDSLSNGSWNTYCRRGFGVDWAAADWLNLGQWEESPGSTGHGGG
jgi:hypothetical protein